MTVKLRSLLWILLAVTAAWVSPLEARLTSPYDPPLSPNLVPSRQGMKAYTEVFKGVAVNSINTTTPGYRSMKSNIVNRNGEVDVEIYRSVDKGATVETRRPLDFIIEGTGYFVVQLPFGVAYTRDGRMTIDKDGNLVTVSNHFPVLSQDLTPIKLSSSAVLVSQKGVIMQDGLQVATLEIVAFEKRTPMKSLGGIFFYLPESESGQYEITPLYTIKQGFFEDSNVSLSEEMVKIPIFKDEHDANSKAAKTVIKSLQTAASIGRSN